MSHLTQSLDVHASSFARCYFLPTFRVFASILQVHPEGKFVVDIDKSVDINDIQPNCRVALRNDSHTLHKILPNKVWIENI